MTSDRVLNRSIRSESGDLLISFLRISSDSLCSASILWPIIIIKIYAKLIISAEITKATGIRTEGNDVDL
jgi:hypothetical protein